MSDLRAMQRLCGLMRKAVQDYEMIAPGDRVNTEDLLISFVLDEEEEK